MAILNISEFTGQYPSSFSVASMPPIASQDVAVGAVSAQSDALNSSTQLVRLVADVACYVAFGADPTAAAEATYLPANATEYFTVRPGMSIKIAVIEA